MDFVPYPKTPRLKRSIVITEKIDGTNAQVVITRAGIHEAVGDHVVETLADTLNFDFRFEMRVGSRTRWITPGKSTDNFGFAGWCRDNADELFKLGEGQHFGEWYGQGSHNPNTPACCEVVPVLSLCELTGVDDILQTLREEGSCAVPGWMKPEGIIVFHSASSQVFKVLLENDAVPKGSL
jgi:hypothetical protein